MTIAKFILASAAAVTISSAALAQVTLTGRIVKIDEANGKITLQHPQAGTVGGATGANMLVDDYKIQDGLAFNAARDGDPVTFTAAQIDGVWTVTKIQKQ